MASLNFEEESESFKAFYANNETNLRSALKKFVEPMESALEGFTLFSIPQGRVKKSDECLSKFARKYRVKLSISIVRLSNASCQVYRTE
jgi:hypothetical protein